MAYTIQPLSSTKDKHSPPKKARKSRKVLRFPTTKRRKRAQKSEHLAWQIQVMEAFRQISTWAAREPEDQRLVERRLRSLNQALSVSNLDRMHREMVKRRGK